MAITHAQQFDSKLTAVILVEMSDSTDYLHRQTAGLSNTAWPAASYLKFGQSGFCQIHCSPGVSLAEQTDSDLRWIRACFLDHVEPFDHIIVHGHTITNSLRREIHHNRIALDTGAYRTGRLLITMAVSPESNGCPDR